MRVAKLSSLSDKDPKNMFKVPKKTWGSWTIVGKHVFNKTYSHMLENPFAYAHTDIVKGNFFEGFVDKYWKVTAWNAAFQAASLCSRGERYLIKDIEQRIR